MRILALAATTCLLLASTSRAEGIAAFDELLAALETRAESEHPVLIETFVEAQQARGGFPIRSVEGDVVFVIATGPGVDEVRLVGDFLPTSVFNVMWSDAGEALHRQSRLHYLRKVFEPGARLDYAFVVAGERIADPLNPRRIFSGPGNGVVSELVMPGHRLQAAAEPWPASPRGTQQAIDADWATPRVTVHLPADLDPRRRHRVVYTTDGGAWAEHINLTTTLDNLAASGDIEPVIAVMIDVPPERNAWHLYNPDFLDYLVRVVEHVDSVYPTRPDAASRVLAGSSSGARAMLFAGMERPDLFGNLLLLSPSMTGPVYYMAPYFAGEKQPSPELRVWMAAGTYEGSIHRDTQALEAWLDRSGVDAVTVYSYQGHSFGAWRAMTVLAMRHFFGAQEPASR